MHQDSVEREIHYLDAHPSNFKGSLSPRKNNVTEQIGRDRSRVNEITKKIAPKKYGINLQINRVIFLVS